ncbi:MAG: DUF3016 domain-containing protein [Puniceicoccaceae bacterium]
MRIKVCSLLILSFFLPSFARGGDLTVTFDPVEDFTDFSLHEPESAEDARIIFEKELQAYWERRLAELLPEGSSLEFHFTDIDMAGDRNMARDATGRQIRLYDDRFLPRLFFAYTIKDAAGEIIQSGETLAMDKRYQFGGSGRIAHEEFAFAFELEALRKWLRGLNLAKE